MNSHDSVRTKKKTLAVTRQSPRPISKYEIIWTCDRRQGLIQRSRTTMTLLLCHSWAPGSFATVARMAFALIHAGWVS